MKTINIFDKKSVIDLLTTSDDVGVIARHKDFRKFINIDENNKHLQKFNSEIYAVIENASYKASDYEFVVSEYDNFIIDNFKDIRGIADTIENENLSFKLEGTKNDFIIKILYKNVVIEIINESTAEIKYLNDDIKFFKGENNFIIINNYLLNEEIDKLNYKKEISLTNDDFEGFAISKMQNYHIDCNKLYMLKESITFNGEDCGSESMGNGITGIYEIVDNEEIDIAIIEKVKEILIDRDKFYERTKEQLNHLNSIENEVNALFTRLNLKQL